MVFSYIEQNSRFSSGFKKYNNEIPPFLHDRPRYFVDHCRTRLVSSEDIPFSAIGVQNVKNGHFHVKSTRTKETYDVSFGDEN